MREKKAIGRQALFDLDEIKHCFRVVRILKMPNVADRGRYSGVGLITNPASVPVRWDLHNLSAMRAIKPQSVMCCCAAVLFLQLL